MAAQQPQVINILFYPIILLSISACGAGTGLALLVASVRTHATDKIKNLTLLKC